MQLRQGRKKSNVCILVAVQFATDMYFHWSYSTIGQRLFNLCGTFMSSTRLKSDGANEMIYRALNHSEVRLILRLKSAITRKYNVRLSLTFTQLGVLLFQSANVQSEPFSIAAGCHCLQRSNRLRYTIYEHVFFFFFFYDVKQRRLIFCNGTMLTYFYFVPFFSRCAMLNIAAATASLSSSSVSLSSSSLSFLAQGVILYLCFSLNPVTPCKGPILTIFCRNRCHLSRI